MIEQRIRKQDTIDEYFQSLKTGNSQLEIDDPKVSVVFDTDEDISNLGLDSAIFRNSELDESDHQFFSIKSRNDE